MPIASQELRGAARRLLRAPGFSAVIVVTLALAIGADTAIFSLVDAVLVHPLPYGDPGRLVMIWEDHSQEGGEARFSVARATFADLRRECRSFADMTAQWSELFNLTGAGEPESVRGARVSANFFTLLGVEPMLGRGFLPEEARSGAAPAAVLSHSLWQRRFAGDRRILGQSLRLDDQVFTVVGVMPPALAVPYFFRAPKDNVEAWVPLVIAGKQSTHGDRVLQVIGRLAPGRTLAQARAETAALARRLATAFPESNAKVGVTLVPLQEQLFGNLRLPVLVLLGAVTCVLLIACANVAGLLLARTLARGREVAVSAALGASRPRLVWQVLGEGLLLAALGGLAGLLVAIWASRLLAGLIPADVPHVAAVRIDAAVLGYAVALTLLTGVGCGLVPALRATGGDLQTALRQAGRSDPRGGRQRGRSALVVGQVALTLLLLIGAGLMLESLQRLRRVDPGFRAENVLKLKLALPPVRYPDEHRQVAFFRDLLQRLESLPGVVAAGGNTRLPLDPGYGTGKLVVEDKPVPMGEEPRVGVRIVTPHYFRALGIPLLRGRELSDHDGPHTRLVALVNRTLARRTWPGEDPVGKRLALGGRGEPWDVVVGVVGDVAHDSLASEPAPEAYLPHTQNASDWFQIVVRTRGDPLVLAAAVRREVRALDRDQPVVGVATLRQHVDETLSRRRFSLVLLGGFAALALVLSAVGVFGLMSYLASRRTWEIGLRMALGARRSQVLGLILGQALRLTLFGIALGLAAGSLLTRWLASQLFQISPTDPLTFLACAAFLAAVAAAAGYLPSRRAAGADPAAALRWE
jgi:putative ABC transport system permease protein